MTTQTLKVQIRYWDDSAKRNLATAEDLLKTKHYDSCLFFCHLALEKAMKGLIVGKTHESAPYIHDLEKLGTLAKISMDDTTRDLLRTISTFNIAARYDDVKFDFYKQCTKKYTEKYFFATQKLWLSLKKHSRQK
ncbi:MAG: HEPN domain-containing protein [Candidatus Uhrbacteria bacterium]|nr:HEPN domain-containing protein [Candidatus Uhrbacteria bacterium]